MAGQVAGDEDEVYVVVQRDEGGDHRLHVRVPAVDVAGGGDLILIFAPTDGLGICLRRVP